MTNDNQFKIGDDVSLDDILKAAQKKPSESLKPGIHIVEIMQVKERPDLAYITAKISEKSGDGYLTVGFKTVAEAETPGTIFGRPIMLSGKGAKFSTGITGLVGALGLSEIPAFQKVYEIPSKKEGYEPQQVVALVSSNGQAYNLVGARVKIRVTLKLDEQSGEKKAVIAGFYRAV